MRIGRHVAALGIALAVSMPFAAVGASVPTRELSPVVLVGPAKAGAGEVPKFSWKPVRGATRYDLVVVDRRDRPVWAWTGSATKVNLGGLPGKRPRGAPGPVVTKGCRWAVFAFDDAGRPVAVSEFRPVSP